MIKYSIIIPTYNSEEVLKSCLDSVVRQSYPNWEVLLMDGASKDNSLSIARSYKDDRIRIYSEPDKGVYDAMNKGINKSSGEWLYFLGSDDYLYNNDVLTTIAPHLTSEYDVVYGEVESDLLEWHKGEWSLSKIHANRCHQAIFYNRQFFGSKLRYNLKYRLLADYDINLRWFLQPQKYRNKYIPIIISHYSTNGISSMNKDFAFYEDVALLTLRYGRKRLPPKYQKRCWISISEREKSTIKKLLFKIPRYYYFVLQKIEELLGISQETLRI